MSPHGSSLVPSSSQLNKVVNPKTSRDSRRQASQLARVFARAAEIQVRSNRHYLIEQPSGSGISFGTGVGRNLPINTLPAK